jgi:RNA polymerase sigma factor (sigma-70 family)
MFSPHNDDDAWKMKEVFDEIKDSVNSLDAETKRVIIERYYEDKTLDKIGKEIGKSRERVRQIENR